MNTPSERIEQIMNCYSLNKNTFSKEIGFKNNVTIGRIINDKREPSLKTLQMIINRFSNLSSEWLLTGRGEMLKERECKKVHEIKNSNPTIVSEPDITGRNIESVKQEYEEKIRLLKERLSDKEDIIASKDQMLSMKDQLLKSKEETLKKSEENYKLLIVQYQAEIQKLKEDLFDRTHIPVVRNVTTAREDSTTIKEKVKKMPSPELPQGGPYALPGK